jgi:hypothetical protein
MAPAVVTISPRFPVAEHERRARVCVARDGVAVIGAAAGDARQVAQLRRLHGRLASDPALDVFGPTDHLDGAVYVKVFAAGGPRPGWWGAAKGADEDDPADVHVQVLEEGFWDTLDT